MIRNRVKELRKECNITQADLADEVGISVSTLRNIELGKEPKTEVAVKLARVLGVTISGLYYTDL